MTYILGTHLGLIDIISDVSLIRCLGNVSTPSRHKFHVVKMTLLPFELEVGVDGHIESI